MKKTYKLTFINMDKDVPKVLLESAEGIKVDIKFGYDICDLSGIKLGSFSISDQTYAAFGFSDQAIIKMHEFVALFFMVAKVKVDGFTLELFEAYISIFNILIPRVSYSYPIENDIKEIFTKTAENRLNKFESENMNDVAQVYLSTIRKISAFESIKFFGIETGKVSTTYHCESFLDIVAASIYHILKSGYIFKKCGNCDNWFVPYTNRNEEYCDRVSPQYNDKTCKEANILIKSNERIKNDEVQKLQKRVYNLYRSKLKAGYGSPEQFEKFKRDKAIWRTDLDKGIKTEDEYIKWLNSHYAKKYS